MRQLAQFDPAALLAALTTQTIAWPETLEGMTLPKWSGGPVGPYNGFTPDERLRHWQKAVILRRLGRFPNPSACAVCGTDKRVGWHSEHYYDLTRCIGLCWPCHMALHRRFARPQGWARRVALSTAPPAWVAELPVKPFDLASWLRSQGDDPTPMNRSRASKSFGEEDYGKAEAA
jgi:hypothetical protein